MKFSHTISFPASPDRVAEMLADEEFTARRTELAGATSFTHHVTQEGEGFRVDVDAVLPTTMVPATYRGLVGETLTVKTLEVWSAPGAEGRRTAEFRLSVAGVPAKVSGEQVLEADASGEGSTLSVSGDVTSSLPFVGKKIENAAVGAVDTVLEAQRRVGVAYLEERRDG